MIKLGIFGDEMTSALLMECINMLPGIDIPGVYFSGNVTVPEDFPNVMSPIDLMDLSTAILILGEKSISFDMIRLILRKSKHVFLKTIPNLNIKEIKELIDLEKEAGTVTFIYNPFNYLPCFYPSGIKFEKPVLLEVRTCFSGGEIKPSYEILLLISAINRFVRSNHKKLDIFGLKDIQDRIIVNLRIEYENGSAANLTISQEKVMGSCELIEPSGSTKYDLTTSQLIFAPSLSQEISAIGNYLNMIQKQENIANSFDKLLNGVHIVDEIREHLRFNEIDF